MEWELRPGAAVLSDLDLESDEELWEGEDDGDHGGWFCVRTDPFPCPAEGCTFVADFMTAAHLVLVWLLVPAHAATQPATRPAGADPFGS